MKSTRESFFTFEGGFYARYHFAGPAPVLQYTTERLAVAYDSQTLRFERFGPPEVVMRWAAEERVRLREQGRAQDAEQLAVSMLPKDVHPEEFNRVEADTRYFVYFLAKRGLV